MPSVAMNEARRERNPDVRGQGVSVEGWRGDDGRVDPEAWNARTCARKGWQTMPLPQTLKLKR